MGRIFSWEQRGPSRLGWGPRSWGLCFQKASWLPQEVPAHLFMGVPRDVGADIGYSLTYASPSKKKLERGSNDSAILCSLCPLPHLKVIWIFKGLSLERKNKDGRLTRPNFKTHYKATVIKIVWQELKDRYIDQLQESKERREWGWKTWSQKINHLLENFAGGLPLHFSALTETRFVNTINIW